VHRGTPRIPCSLPELLHVTSCMVAIQAAVWCLRIRIIKKKQAHCLQAIGKVVLRLLWQGYKSSIAIMYS